MEVADLGDEVELIGQLTSDTKQDTVAKLVCTITKLVLVQNTGQLGVPTAIRVVDVGDEIRQVVFARATVTRREANVCGVRSSRGDAGGGTSVLVGLVFNGDRNRQAVTNRVGVTDLVDADRVAGDRGPAGR